MKNVFKFFLVFLFCYIALFLLNISALKNWLLSGDDLFSLSNSISDPLILINRLMSNFSGQYRHITYYLFSFYKPLLPNNLGIFLANLALLSVIPTLLFFLIRKKVGNLLKIIIISTIFFTPIFYYHTYTISSLANNLMVIIVLVLLFYFENKETLVSWKYSLGFLLLILVSMAIKETFIVPMTIYCVVQIYRIIKKEHFSLIFLFLPVVAFCFYLISRVSSYTNSTPSDYFFVFELKNILANLFNMISWIVNYPRGWQFGAPIRYPLIQPLIALSNAVILTTIFWLNLIKNKKQTFIYLLFIISSVVLFLFLNNNHVFYMDLPFILIMVLFSKTLDEKEKGKLILPKFLIFIFFITNLSNLFLIKPQWLEYSFVANSNKSAINYKNILETNNYSQYDQICISDHQRGGFGTEDGNLINHFSKKKLRIMSFKESTLPSTCFNEKTLRLKNDAWSYYSYDE